jgi:hypothetical protein
MKNYKTGLWSEDEVKILLEHYDKDGVEYCATLINRSIKAIDTKMIGVRLDGGIKKEAKKPNRMPKDYYKLKCDLNDPNFVYFLGLFWADGSVKNSTIALEFSITDLPDIKNVVDKFGTWREYRRLRTTSKTETVNLSICGKELLQFFYDYEYDKKSTIPPTKILKVIPDKLLYLFYRGLIDGDGSIYFNKKQKTYGNKISITSSYGYDWTFFINLLKSIGITDTPQYEKSYQNNESKSSDVQICKANDIITFGDYIYKNYENKPIGLKRKYDKYMLIKTHTLEKWEIDKLRLKKCEDVLNHAIDNNITIKESCKLNNLDTKNFDTFKNSISKGEYFSQSLDQKYCDKISKLLKKVS